MFQLQPSGAKRPGDWPISTLVGKLSEAGQCDLGTWASPVDGGLFSDIPVQG